ncbi:MAG TPA: hypothetical protein VMJ10_04295 [Kofleriaceae bacterium]|nr:hypothetical protein [Kofleriaceae bacterium]
MRAWLLLLAGCGAAVGTPERVTPADSAGKFDCKLAPPYQGALKYPGLTDRAVLQCKVTNGGLDARELCEQPYVGVVWTGALYTAHQPACSPELVPGATEQFAVHLDMPRALCDDARGGCVVRAFALGLDDAPDAAAVVAMARELEAAAPAAGRDRPTVRECDALVEQWDGAPAFARYASFLSRRDELLLACGELSRADFACLRAARDATDADRCAPIVR